MAYIPNVETVYRVPDASVLLAHRGITRLHQPPKHHIASDTRHVTAKKTFGNQTLYVWRNMMLAGMQESRDRQVLCHNHMATTRVAFVCARVRADHPAAHTSKRPTTGIAHLQKSKGR